MHMKIKLCNWGIELSELEVARGDEQAIYSHRRTWQHGKEV